LFGHTHRWSAIAAKLPGRTDNEIKNVWHTHLKKRLEPTNKPEQRGAQAAGAGKKHRPKRGGAKKATVPATTAPVSPERSAASSSVTESSSMTEQEQEQGNTGSSPGFPKEESFTSSASDAEEFQFDDTFWSETLSMPLESFDVPMEPSDALGSSSVGADGDLDYWLRVFMESGDVHQELPQI